MINIFNIPHIKHFTTFVVVVVVFSVRDLPNRYIQISGSAHFQISSLKGKKIAYKYQIVKPGGKPVHWDYIYKPYGLWDHIMKVPDHKCVNGGE